MADANEDTLEERLKAALWFSIGKIVDEETLKLGVNATPQFIGALTEMVWAQIGTVGREASLAGLIYSLNQENVTEDLQSFSKHAGRRVISSQDVMLLARKNDGLAAVLKNFLDKQEPLKKQSKSSH